MFNNNTFSFYTIIYLISCTALLSCVKNVKPLPEMEVVKNETNEDICNTTNVSYSNDIAPLIMSSCAVSGCHVPNGFKDFSTYASLNSQIDLSGVTYFISRIKPSGGMPPSYTTGPTSISLCNADKLEAWLNQGYLNN